MKEERKTDVKKTAAIKWLENAVASGGQFNLHKSNEKQLVYRSQAYELYKQHGTIEAVKTHLMGEGSIEKRETLKEAFLESKVAQAQARHESVLDASAWLREQIAKSAPLVAPSSKTHNCGTRGALVKIYKEEGWSGVLSWERKQKEYDKKRRLNTQKFVNKQDKRLGEMRKLQGDGAGPSGAQDDDKDAGEDMFDSYGEMLDPDEEAVDLVDNSYDDAGDSYQPDPGVPDQPDARDLHQHDAGVPDQPDAGVPNKPDAGGPYHPDDRVPYQPDAGVPNQPDIGASSQPDQGAKRYTGIVKWFNAKKGFGFICRNDNQKDIFVHQSSIVKKNPRHHHRSLDDKETVEFEIKQEKKGVDVAINVTGPRGYEVKGKEAFEDSSYSYEDYYNNYKSRLPKGGV